MMKSLLLGEGDAGNFGYEFTACRGTVCTVE